MNTIIRLAFAAIATALLIVLTPLAAQEASPVGHPALSPGNFHADAALDISQVTGAPAPELYCFKVQPSPANWNCYEPGHIPDAVYIEHPIVWVGSKAEYVERFYSHDQPAPTLAQFDGYKVGKRIVCAEGVETDNLRRGEFAHCDGPTLSKTEVIICKRSTVKVKGNTARCAKR